MTYDCDSEFDAFFSSVCVRLSEVQISSKHFNCQGLRPTITIPGTVPYLPPHKMTTTTTALSIQKTATLLQNLVDLKTQTDHAFPPIIDECVAELIDAQTAFIEKIDEYICIVRNMM